MSFYVFAVIASSSPGYQQKRAYVSSPRTRTRVVPATVSSDMCDGAHIRPSPRMYTSISTYVYVHLHVCIRRYYGRKCERCGFICKVFFCFASKRRTNHLCRQRTCLRLRYEAMGMDGALASRLGQNIARDKCSRECLLTADARVTPKYRGAQRARRIQASSARSRSLTVQQAHTALPAGNGGHTALHRDRR